MISNGVALRFSTISYGAYCVVIVTEIIVTVLLYTGASLSTHTQLLHLHETQGLQ